MEEGIIPEAKAEELSAKHEQSLADLAMYSVELQGFVTRELRRFPKDIRQNFLSNLCEFFQCYHIEEMSKHRRLICK